MKNKNQSLPSISFWLYFIILAGILITAVWLMFLKADDNGRSDDTNNSDSLGNESDNPNNVDNLGAEEGPGVLDAQIPAGDEELLGALQNLGTLAGFEVFEERISEREIEDTAIVGAKTTAANDIIISKIKAVVAQNGQIFYDSTQAGTIEGTVIMPVETLCPNWPESLLGFSEGGQRRLILPASEASMCAFATPQSWPSNYDAVVEIELLSITERTDIGTDAPAENFEPLSEPLSELELQDIQVGQGKRVESVETIVVVNYTGFLADDGQTFDASRAATFQLNQVIEGWQQGLLNMQEGGIRRILIPAELAYGEQGSGSIPPNADLVFDVQLISIITPSEQVV